MDSFSKPIPLFPSKPATSHPLPIRAPLSGDGGTSDADSFLSGDDEDEFDSASERLEEFPEFGVAELGVVMERNASMPKARVSWEEEDEEEFGEVSDDGDGGAARVYEVGERESEGSEGEVAESSGVIEAGGGGDGDLEPENEISVDGDKVSSVVDEVSYTDRNGSVAVGAGLDTGGEKARTLSGQEPAAEDFEGQTSDGQDLVEVMEDGDGSDFVSQEANVGAEVGTLETAVGGDEKGGLSVSPGSDFGERNVEDLNEVNVRGETYGADIEAENEGPNEKEVGQEEAPLGLVTQDAMVGGKNENLNIAAEGHKSVPKSTHFEDSMDDFDEARGECSVDIPEDANTGDGNKGLIEAREGEAEDVVPAFHDFSFGGENEGLKEVGEEEEEKHVAEGPARVAILESAEAAKQFLKDLDCSSFSGSSNSGSFQDFSNEIDGQIVSESDEEVLTDEENDGKEPFDSAALAALLRAATESSEGSVEFSASDAARIFSVHRPAGLGTSMRSLRPAPSQPVRSNIFTPSDLAVVSEPEDMSEEEKKVHGKIEQVRVKFLRLVQRLGYSPEDTVAAQVLYRLGLAEGIKSGRQISRAFSIESAKKKALQLEEDGKADLEFSCNILVLGKSGVGKSAAINSIFSEQMMETSASGRATTRVTKIVGVVEGVSICLMDTPGLSPFAMDQASNIKILTSIKKHMKKHAPDIVLYVDRLDNSSRDSNDLPLLKSITDTLGSSIWFNAIVGLTHAASAPPDGPRGTPLNYDVFVAQRSHVVQDSIRQAACDMRLMNPVALMENHPSCRRNREGHRVLPNGIIWRSQLLLLCYSSKILSEANSLLKIHDKSPGKFFGFRVRSPPLPYLLSSLLQSRPHPKLPDQGGDNIDSDIDLEDLSDSDQEVDEYDQLPPFKPLKKSQFAMLTKEQQKAYYEEYDYRVMVLQKKQLKEELKRLKEMKKRGKGAANVSEYDRVDDYDQDCAPAAVPIPLPDMALPPTFDSGNPGYRYRFLEPTSRLLMRPVLDSHGWDHDCGYNGVSLEENLAIAGRFPGGIAVQVTKDKKDFTFHLDSSICVKHGENGSSLACFDIQSIGKQLAYILRSETKFKTYKKNKTAAGISVTFLGENVATGLKVEDQILIGKRVSLVGSAGTMCSQSDVAYGVNIEAKLQDKDYPIGRDSSTLGLSLVKWRKDVALGANLQSQFSVGRNSKMAVRVGLNNKRTGQISIRTSTSDQYQIALLGILPLAVSIYRSIWPKESY